MASSRFSIGIDLGTTNCALAFVPLDGEARSQIFGIGQWDTSSTIMESSALPITFISIPFRAGSSFSAALRNGALWCPQPPALSRAL